MRRTSPPIVFVLAAALVLAPGLGERAARASSAWTSTSGLIAFRSDRDGEPDVFTIDQAGSTTTKLTANSGIRDTSPTWSPEGLRIAYVRKVRSTGKPDLFEMNAVGRGRIRLTATPVPERDPAWSTDGTRIAYSAPASSGEPYRIFVMNADGTTPEQLTTQSAGSADRSPAWSPDGARIAFVSDRAGGFPEIYLMNADGSGVTRLTNNVLIDGNPSWSPDGTKLAVERCCADGSSEIYSIDVATGVETDLTNTTDQEFDPAWSSDGTMIAYVGVPAGGGNVDIWTMSADGSGQTRLTNEPADDLSPDWQPLPICTITGTSMADVLVGTEGNDVICGLGGADTISGGDGSDLVFGGAGNDVIYGELGSDLLFGEGGSDTLDGGPDYDGLNGGPGTDPCLPGDDGAFTRQCE
jgi:Tol biopolymer transport system component